MDIAGLCSFEGHQLWHEALRTAWLTPPPPGYRPVSWQQLENADRALFVYVAKKCSSGTGTRPSEAKTQFELAWIEGIFVHEVRYLLTPLQGSSDRPALGPSSSSPAASVLPAARDAALLW